MDKIKSFFSWLRGAISPAYVTMLVAAFVLWYITKLGDTYTTDHEVTVVVDGEEFEVDCTIRGKGTDLINYTVSSRRSRFTVPATELTFDKEITDDDGLTYRHITTLSLQQALAARMSDIEVVSVGSVPALVSREE